MTKHNQSLWIILVFIWGSVFWTGCVSVSTPEASTTPAQEKESATSIPEGQEKVAQDSDQIVLPVKRQVAPSDIRAQVRWFDGGDGGFGLGFCPIRQGSVDIQIFQEATLLGARDRLYEGDPVLVCGWDLSSQSLFAWELESANGDVVVTGTSESNTDGIIQFIPSFSYLHGLYQVEILSKGEELKSQFRLLPSESPKIWTLGDLAPGQTIAVYYAGFEPREVITTVWYSESSFNQADYWTSWRTVIDASGHATEAVFVSENARALGYSILAVKSKNPVSKWWEINGDSSGLDLMAAAIAEIGGIQSGYPTENQDEALQIVDNSSYSLKQVDMGTISEGETKSGVLKSILEAHNWTFEARSGNTYHIQALFPNAKFIGERISIIDPNGKLTYECGKPFYCYSSRGCEDIQSGEGVKYRADVSGDFTIRLDMFGEGDGTYSLSLKSSKEAHDIMQHEIIIDDLDEMVQLGGPSSGWRTAPFGYKGQTHWTYCTDEGVSNWGKWTPQLPASGDYEVFVFVPEHNAGTKQAQYRIFHNGVDDESVVRQADYANEWVSLGTYEFAADGEEYVYLDDNTGEARSRGITIGFDAVKFVYIP